MADKFITDHTEWRTTASITISARQGITVAWVLFWHSVAALIRRQTVTFDMREDVPRA